MTSETVQNAYSMWTVDTYAAHSEAIRVIEKELSEEKTKHLTDIIELNDRRYSEVSIEKEKALKIKEIADLTALELARESQVYKDERNDILREQSLKETGIYATRDDLAEVVTRFDRTIKPVLDYVSAQKGVVNGSQITMGKVFAGIAAIGTIIGILVVLVNMFVN